jgi:hypothetical protein
MWKAQRPEYAFARNFAKEVFVFCEIVILGYARRFDGGDLV